MANSQHTITLSFKKNELWLYENLKKYSSAGSVIKDILIKHFLENDSKKNNECFKEQYPKEQSDSIIDIF